MTFSQTTQYLYNLLADYQLHGRSAYKQGLEGIRCLCGALDNPQDKFRSIHVAGTNGKGSTASMTAAVLQAAGYRTGLYTSPHLTSFCERIKINGTEIDEQAVVDFVAQNRTLIERERPSFFELTTAMAFWYFALHQADFAVVEAGLGGRLDSTNILQPAVSVITRIALDHCDLLGNTLPAIAAEKAGIIKPHTPVAAGVWQSGVHPVLERQARRHCAPLVYACHHYRAAAERTDSGVQFFDIKKNDGTMRHFAIDLLGEWQGENLCTALTAIDILRQTALIPDSAVQEGLENAGKLTHLRGRWQTLQTSPLVIADIAHNADGLARTMAQAERYGGCPMHIVFGIAADKDLDAVLPLLPRRARYYFAGAASPRALSASVLACRAAAAGLQGRAYPSVPDAFGDALRQAARSHFIYVGGSAMVAAEVMQNFYPNT